MIMKLSSCELVCEELKVTLGMHDLKVFILCFIGLTKYLSYVSLVISTYIHASFVLFNGDAIYIYMQKEFWCSAAM